MKGLSYNLGDGIHRGTVVRTTTGTVPVRACLAVYIFSYHPMFIDPLRGHQGSGPLPGRCRQPPVTWYHEGGRVLSCIFVHRKYKGRSLG